MEPSSQTWVRKIFVAVALVVGLIMAALPATAAPTTKKYSAALLDGVNEVQRVTVQSTTTGTNTVRLRLTNEQDSQQSFGSAQLDFDGPPLPSGVNALGVARSGWAVKEVVKGTRYLLVNSGPLNPVPPGVELLVTIALPGTAGTTKLETQVKQSNDFRGTNNAFDLVASPAQPLEIVTEPAGTPCPGTCTPSFISSLNKVTADLTVRSSSPFTYIARFTTDRLRCDTIPFGSTVTPEPFQMDSTSTSPVSKTLVLTFPRALANLVPDNGTPHHPVCAGGDARFPGSSTMGAITHPHEGLLLNCSDPAYTDAIAAFEQEQMKDPGNPDKAFLPMCVQSRARNAGKLIVTVLVQSTTVDPRVW